VALCCHDQPQAMHPRVSPNIDTLHAIYRNSYGLRLSTVPPVTGFEL
jgi:hypothetical protein